LDLRRGSGQHLQKLLVIRLKFIMQQQKAVSTSPICQHGIQLHMLIMQHINSSKPGISIGAIHACGCLHHKGLEQSLQTGTEWPRAMCQMLLHHPMGLTCLLPVISRWLCYKLGQESVLPASVWAILHRECSSWTVSPLKRAHIPAFKHVNGCDVIKSLVLVAKGHPGLALSWQCHPSLTFVAARVMS